jgi:hypothetical protein
LSFLACRYSFSVFWAGFFSMLFFEFLSFVAMLTSSTGLQTRSADTDDQDPSGRYVRDIGSGHHRIGSAASVFT